MEGSIADVERRRRITNEGEKERKITPVPASAVGLPKHSKFNHET